MFDNLTPANFDVDVATQVLINLIAKGVPMVMNGLSALMLLAVGLFIAGRIKKLAIRVMQRAPQLDATLSRFVASLLYYLILAIVIISVLSRFGIETTSFAALLGAAGLAIGLALQGTLSHVASGAMLMVFRPFKLDDYVIAGGHEGTVRDISLFTTTLASIDNKNIIIPNARIWEDSITNFSANTIRRLDLVFGISYADDIGKAISVVRAVLTETDSCLEDPEPVVAVDSLGDFSVNLTCRVWVPRAEYLPMKWHLNQRVKEAFDAAGITIPFPTYMRYSETDEK